MSKKVQLCDKAEPDLQQTVKAANVPAPLAKPAREAESWGRVWELHRLLRSPLSMKSRKLSHRLLLVTVGHFTA